MRSIRGSGGVIPGKPAHPNPLTESNAIASGVLFVLHEFVAVGFQHLFQSKSQTRTAIESPILRETKASIIEGKQKVMS